MDHCNVQTTLFDAGLSATSRRVAVLSALMHARLPLCAKGILEQIGWGLRINRVTVYRILDSFKAAGIIREIPTEHGEKFYEIACRHNPLHPHLYCRVCRNLSCLPATGLAEEWLHRFRLGNDSIESIVVNLTGVCRTCSTGKR